MCPETSQWWQKCGFFGWDFLFLALLLLGFLVSFFSILGGAPRIDLPLSRLFSLAISVLVSFFSRFSLLVGETKIVLLEEAIWEELESSYPKPVVSEANFWSSTFHLALHWKSSPTELEIGTILLQASWFFQPKSCSRTSVLQWFDWLYQPFWIALLVPAPLH